MSSVANGAVCFPSRLCYFPFVACALDGGFRAVLTESEWGSPRFILSLGGRIFRLVLNFIERKLHLERLVDFSQMRLSAFVDTVMTLLLSEM